MDYIKENKEAWDKWTNVHIKSDFYNIDAFKAGKCSLNPIEREQLGDVNGKRLLHLQCHFGQDTLSWARLGAKVTGVDLSSEAIKQAQSLNITLGLDGEFIVSDIYQFGQENKQTYDLVYTSYGVLCWLPDLNQWAQTIYRALNKGGEFHLIEFHPFNDLVSGYAYFPKKTADIEKEETYTENNAGTASTIHTWPHSLSEVITALLSAGLNIEQVSEHRYSPYNCFDNLELIEGKGYQSCHKGQQIPLVYSIKARKVLA